MSCYVVKYGIREETVRGGWIELEDNETERTFDAVDVERAFDRAREGLGRIMSEYQSKEVVIKTVREKK